MATLSAAFLLLASSPTFTGDWVTNDRTALVRIAPCGGRFCGRIVRVIARGVPTTDVNNPDRSLRSRPLAGLTVLSGLTPAGAGGRAYNPRNGHSYRATLGLNADGSLRVTGCVLLICRSQTWTRR
jgi:uncharacterized protein (DUF2147 family)